MGASYIPPDPATFLATGSAAHSAVFSFGACGGILQAEMATTLLLLGRTDAALGYASEDAVFTIRKDAMICVWMARGRVLAAQRKPAAATVR